jgi:hypothetical protein
LKPRIAPKMPLKPFARFRVADRLALTLDVAALSSGAIEDVIGRLDQAHRFKLPQKSPVLTRSTRSPTTLPLLAMEVG